MTDDSGLRVAIVGRPNVGKSTLFNRLIGRRLALVDDTPGVTRDWRAGAARVGGLGFTAIDTAGLDEADEETLEGRMRRQTERAVQASDVVLFLIDARAGVTPMDQHFGRWLRASGKPVILAANKAEGRAGLGGLLEAFELGLGEPLALSAEHGEGMGELYEALLPYAQARAGRRAVEEAPGVDTGGPEAPPGRETENRAGSQVENWAENRAENREEDGDRAGEQPDHADPLKEAGGDADLELDHEDDQPERPVSVAIVGRPNVGKSTLLNALIGEERVLTGPEAGMTRDAIMVPWHWQGHNLMLVDTAGLRRRARIDDGLEKLATADALRSVRMAQVVVVVIDAATGFDKQDLTIARLVVEEGRALVIAANKWDTVANPGAVRKTLAERLEASLPQVRGVRVVTLSASRGQGLERLLAAIFETYATWNRRIPTAILNQWLLAATDRHPPPLVQGRPIRLRYVTQIKTRPPTFAVWINKPLDLPESYIRYLIQSLRDQFDLPATPIRLMLRKGRNPFAGG